MPHALDNPSVVALPVRGEGWMAVTTPAARVPSHDVDMLGQRYAYDLLKVDRRNGARFHPANSVRPWSSAAEPVTVTRGEPRFTRRSTGRS